VDWEHNPVAEYIDELAVTGAAGQAGGEQITRREAVPDQVVGERRPPG
jgi:hypothetical protein